MGAREDFIIMKLLKQRAKYRRALEFYANPENYVAIAFLPDPPCGDFIKDFSDDHGFDYSAPGYRPGKRARKALRWNRRRKCSS